MNKLQIIANQIQTDMASIIGDLEQGIATEDIMKDMIRLHGKILRWSKEANEIMDEAETIDNIADSQPEVQAERGAEEHNN